jgi:hypothetical protein
MRTGEEPLAVGFVGLNIFSVKAVFAAVGGGFAAACGGFRASGFAAVGLGSEFLFGGRNLSFGEYSFPWEDRRTGFCRRDLRFGVKCFVFRERFLAWISDRLWGEDASSRRDGRDAQVDAEEYIQRFSRR